MINKFLTAAHKINLHNPPINYNALTVTNDLLAERKSQSEGGGGRLEGHERHRNKRLGDERQNAAAAERLWKRIGAG